MDCDNATKVLNVSDFAQLFGTTETEVTEFCGKQISGYDLRYVTLEGKDRDDVILNILKRIEAPDIPVSGASRHEDWERGWGENLKEFIDSGYDVETLVPKYFKKNVPVRFMGDYILSPNPQFVLDCTRVFRSWIFQKYLTQHDAIYEFGCGPATHLSYLAEHYPDKKLIGLDWARPSQEIIRLLAQNRGWNIEGHNFDFFNPDPDVHLETNSAVYTFGALEQIGDRHEQFLDFLLREKPAICVNVECISEFYDESKMPDYLALRYHKRKNYLDGYLTRLRQLATEGLIQIIAEHHQQYGNMFDDSHSYVVWRPL
jgi:hypothetical protein